MTIPFRDNNVDCSFDGTTTAVCSVSQTWSLSASHLVTTKDVETYNTKNMTMIPVTITAGWDNTIATTTKTAGSPSSTGSTPTSSTASGSSSSTTHTGGLPQVTGNARVVAGGVAAAAAFLAL